MMVTRENESVGHWLTTVWYGRVAGIASPHLAKYGITVASVEDEPAASYACVAE